MILMCQFYILKQHCLYDSIITETNMKKFRYVTNTILWNFWLVSLTFLAY